MKMISITKNLEMLLNKVSRSVTLWSMKTAYKGMNEAERLEARNNVALKMWQLTMNSNRDKEDWKLAELWSEFYDWTTTYENRL